VVRSSGLPPRSSWLSALGFALLSIALTGSLWIVPYLPTNDGPEGVFAVHMENHFGDPGVIYPEVFTPAPQFAGRGFTVLFEPLEASLGWQRGLQVALSVLVLLYAWGFVALVRAVDPRRVPLAFLGFPLALSWSLYMGFFAFVVSSGVGLFILAFGMGARGEGAVRRGLVAALLLLQAFLHMFGAIVTGVVLATVRVARAPWGRKLRELATVALTGLPAAGLVLAAVWIARRGALHAAFARTFRFLPLREVLATWPRTLAPGSLPSALAVTLLVVASMVIIGVRAGTRGTAPTDRAFAALAILFLLASILAPRDVPGWQCFSQRFIGVGLVLAIVALPFERAPRGAAAALFAISLVWTLLAYPLHRRLAALTVDAVAGLAAPVHFHRIWLPVELASPPAQRTADVPVLDPLSHIPGLYETALGGVTPYTFASNPATWPFALRPDAIHPPPVPNVEQLLTLIRVPAFRTDRVFREEQEDVLATFGMFYEGVVVTGARPADHALWERRGFVADWAQGSVIVAHFEPCRVLVAVPGGGALPRLDVGIGETETLRDAEVTPASTGQDGAHLVVEQGPCGHAWVRPHWDAVGTDGAKTVTYCGNAGGNGMLDVEVTREGGRVVCAKASSTPTPTAPAIPP
jgi:hypothetical protein